MKELDYKHYFTVVNGKFVFEQKDMLEYIKRSFEGKRGFAIIKPVKEDVSPNQYAYYFGGIIRKECMVSESFAGLKEAQIHEILLREVEGDVKPIKNKVGVVKMVEVTPDFSSFSKRRMAEYIQKLIAHLQVEYDIHPKPAEHYKYNKFYIKPQTFSHEDLERNTQSCTKFL